MAFAGYGGKIGSFGRVWIANLGSAGQSTPADIELTAH
jgi:hypothetical protein